MALLTLTSIQSSYPYPTPTPDPKGSEWRCVTAIDNSTQLAILRGEGKLVYYSVPYWGSAVG